MDSKNLNIKYRMPNYKTCTELCTSENYSEKYIFSRKYIEFRNFINLQFTSIFFKAILKFQPVSSKRSFRSRSQENQNY